MPRKHELQRQFRRGWLWFTYGQFSQRFLRLDPYHCAHFRRLSLFSRPSTVLSFVNMVHLFANEFTRLGRWCFALLFVRLARSTVSSLASFFSVREFTL